MPNTAMINPSPKSEKFKMKYWLWYFIFFAVVFIFLTYYFSEVKKEFVLLESVNPYWLTLALLSQFMTYFFTALIYLLLLRGYNLRHLPRLGELIKASVVSLFFNQTVPSAGISGNTYFFKFLSRFSISMEHVVGLIITELLIFYAAMELVILLLLVSCLLTTATPHLLKAALGGGILIYLIFGVVIAFAGRKNLVSRLFKKLGRIKIFRFFLGRTSGKLGNERISEQAKHIWRFVRQNKHIAAAAFICQLLVIVADAFTIYTLFKGLGISVSAYKVILGLVCAKIVSILPFLPGALILYESSMTYFFTSLGIPLGPSVIVTLVYRFLSFWIPIPTGFILYRRWLNHLPEQAKSR